MLIDTHCHLNFHAFTKDLDDVVRRAREAGVEKMIVPGTDLQSSRRAVEIAKNYPGACFAAVGIHPHHVQDPNIRADDNVRHQLEELIKEREVVAVGEVGLDYYRYTKTKYDNTDITAEIKQKQKELLTLQLDLALIHNLPVILHCREAFDDMIQTISTFAPNFAKATADKSTISRSTISNSTDKISHNSPAVPMKTNYIKPTHISGVWHCFGGNAKQLQIILTMGYYVGFDGNITYDETQYSPLVSFAPLDRILLETDSPFLTPFPFRGSRNEPAYVYHVARAVAKYHFSSLSIEINDQANFSKVIHISTENAKTLFRL